MAGRERHALSCLRAPTARRRIVTPLTNDDGGCLSSLLLRPLHSRVLMYLCRLTWMRRPMPGALKWTESRCKSYLVVRLILQLQTCTFFADRTATRYVRLLASSCRLTVRPSVCLSVCNVHCALCIVALRVGVKVEKACFCRQVSTCICPFRHFCCRPTIFIIISLDEPCIV